MFTRPATPVEAGPPDILNAPASAAPPGKRPRGWSLTNWPVRYKVLAIVLVPLVLATIFGGLRVQGAMTNASGLRLAAARADVIPAITKYMSALDSAMLSSSTGHDVEGAKKNYEARKYELQTRLADTDVIPDVRSGVGTLLNGGQALLDKVVSNSIGLRERITTYAPILLTAEDLIDASVRVDSEKIRAQAQGLSRAVGARGQMTMQEILITRGGDIPEPELRTSMITLAGTEPSTLFGMAEVLGTSSTEAKTLQQQMVTRMAVMSDPTSSLIDNPDLLRSIRVTDGIAEQIIKDATASVTKAVQTEADDRRNAAIREAALALGAMVIALGLVLLVARAIVRPLRVLRNGALKVAHADLEDEIARIRAGSEPIPEPLPVHTTEEIGQVAHAVDELHSQALLLAGDEARLRLMVGDMFETMSRRNRSLVDQQLSLIDGLERNEEDPERLDSLFRLDHLAARLRRNSANLLVLAGAQLAREQRDPIPLSTAINAAVSEVEDYRRVETASVPDCTVIGAAAGALIQLLAELIDNALRYSAPETSVWVAAARGGDGGVLLRISDSGLGMNDSDRRIANKRLHAGGEVSADNARHMGLFVVGRLAARHGIRVGLRGPTAEDERSGTTAEVYLPLSVLVEGAGVTRMKGRRGRPPAVREGPLAGKANVEQLGTRAPVPAPAYQAPQYQSPEYKAPQYEAPAQNGADSEAGSDPLTPNYPPVTPVAPVTLLPRRNPGSSGITDVPVVPTELPPQRERRELATPWWEENGTKQEPAPEAPRGPARGPEQEPAKASPSSPPTAPMPAQKVSDTSAFFAARTAAPTRAKAASPDVPAEKPASRAAANPSETSAEDTSAAENDDVIYQRMLSEIMGDPHDLVNSPDLDWQSVWDRGWTLAAAAEVKPVDSHTDHGLPVRQPGARLVPGAANGSGRHGQRDQDQNHDQNQDQDQDQDLVAVRTPQHSAGLRDPEAVRASFSSHFGGVRNARSHAKAEADFDAEGPDQPMSQ